MSSKRKKGFYSSLITHRSSLINLSSLFACHLSLVTCHCIYYSWRRFPLFRFHKGNRDDDAKGLKNKSAFEAFNHHLVCRRHSWRGRSTGAHDGAYGFYRQTRCLRPLRASDPSGPRRSRLFRKLLRLQTHGALAKGAGPMHSPLLDSSHADYTDTGIHLPIHPDAGARPARAAHTQRHLKKSNSQKSYY